MAKPVSSTPFKALEDEAYHAFREWPIFLVMRQKELSVHLTPAAPSPTPSGQANAAEADPHPVKDGE